MDGTFSIHGSMKNVYGTAVGKRREKETFMRHWCRWEDEIKMQVIRKGLYIRHVIHCGHSRAQSNAQFSKYENEY